MKNSLKIIFTVLLLAIIQPLKAEQLSDTLSEEKKHLSQKNNLITNNNVANSKKVSLEKNHGICESFEKIKLVLYSVIGGLTMILMIVSFFAVKYFKSYQKEKYHKELQMMAKNNHINSLEQKINIAFEEIIELAQKNDSYFLPRFKEVYPEFFGKFTSEYPSLTLDQLKFCALLRLNFSTKEIADYTNISARSVEIKKSRLRKQLKIDSSEDLNKWMVSF